MSGDKNTPLQTVNIVQAPQAEAVNGSSDIDLTRLWQILFGRWRLVGAISGIAAVSAAAISLMMTPVFRAEVTMVPIVEEKGGSSLLAGQLGDLAALAGINLQGRGDNNAIAIATLRSRALAENYINDEGLLRIFYSDRWDSAQKRWQLNNSGIEDIPSLSQAYELFFKHICNITEDKKAGLIKLAFEWKDPVLAAQWANSFAKRANAVLQKEAIENSQRSIAYLQQQLQKTGSVEVQQAIYRLIESQTKNAMVASIRQDYAFKIIDPAVVPEKKVRPNRSQITLFGMISGLLLGIIAAYVIEYRSSGHQRGGRTKS